MKRDAPQDGAKTAPSAPPARPPLRSRTVNTFTFIAGLATAGIGLLGVIIRPGGVLDIGLILGGLLVAVAGLVLRRRNQRT